MLEKNYQSLDKQLKNLADSIEDITDADLGHQHELRRGLLNSVYYSNNFAIRWYYRLFSFSKRFIVMSTGMGVIVLCVVTYNIYDKHASVAKEVSGPTPYVKTVEASEIDPEYLQDLYKYGYVSYSHENPDGCRVYKAVQGEKELEITDDKPYIIDVVLAN